MNYDDFSATFSRSRRNHPWKEIDTIIQLLQEAKITSILDVGCGNGRFLEEAERLNFTPSHYLGIDASAGMIEEARRLHPSFHFETLKMQDVETISDTFESILLLASFHHLRTQEERKDVLEKIYHRLVPGGKLFMTNWNLLDQPRYESHHAGNGDFQIKIGSYTRFYHGFTCDELDTLFHDTGFTIRENHIFPGGRNLFSVCEKRNSF